MGDYFDEHAAAARWRFERHHDPIAAWQVYYAARALGRSVPDWVGNYLDAVASRIVTERDAWAKNPERVTAAISAALGFKSKDAGTVFARAAKASRDEELALLVLVNVRRGRQVKAAIFDIAKARSLSIATVERAWRALPKNLKASEMSGKRQ